MRRMIGMALVLGTMGAMAVGSVTVTPMEEGKPAAPVAPSSMAAGTAGATSQPGESALGVDDVNKLMDAGKWREALQMIGRLYGMPGLDKPGLLMMRGECQLQIHEMGSAVGTLQQASRDANAANNTVEANEAAAFAFLIQKSMPQNLYTPVNSSEKTPIDIVDKRRRKVAYEALLGDEMVVLQSKERAAVAAGTLPPFLEIARDVPALKGIERNANGGTAQSDQFSKEAAKSAGKVMTNALSGFDTQINQISMMANQLVQTGGGRNYGGGAGGMAMGGGMRRQGLTGENVQTLQNIEDTCGKIPLAVQELGKALENPDPFAHLATHAQSTGTRARQARMKDYSMP